MLKHTIYFIIVLQLLASINAFADNNANYLYHKYESLSIEKLRDMGSDFYNSHQAEDALACFSVIVNKCSSSNDHEMREKYASALNNRGCVYKYMFFDYYNAYRDLAKSLKVCKEEKLDRLLPIVYINLGTLLNDYSRQYASTVVKKEAMDMFLSGFNGALKVKNWELLATTFVNMAEFNHTVNLAPFSKLFRNDIPQNIPNVRYARYLYKAIECLQKNDYNGARTNFNKQLEVIDWHNTPERNAIVTRMNIATVSLKEGNNRDAVDALLIAKNDAQQFSVKDLSFKISDQLSQVYEKMEMTDSAKFYRIQYLEEKDSLISSNQLTTVGEQNFIMELQEEEEKLRELTHKHKLQKIAIALTSIILLIIVVFSIIIIRKNKQLTSRNKSLYKRMQELMDTQEKQNEMLKSQNTESPTDLSTPKYSNSNLDIEAKDQLLRRIKEVMNTPSVICEQGFSVSQLAQLVDSNTTYVSQVINQMYGHSFNVLLGNQRIIEACRRIRDEQQHKNLTIEAISQSVGFKSRVTFVNAFKRVVGLTPSDYIKMAQSQEQEKA